MYLSERPGNTSSTVTNSDVNRWIKSPPNICNVHKDYKAKTTGSARFLKTNYIWETLREIVAHVSTQHTRHLKGTQRQMRNKDYIKQTSRRTYQLEGIVRGKIMSITLKIES